METVMQVGSVCRLTVYWGSQLVLVFYRHHLCTAIIKQCPYTSATSHLIDFYKLWNIISSQIIYCSQFHITHTHVIHVWMPACMHTYTDAYDTYTRTHLRTNTKFAVFEGTRHLLVESFKTSSTTSNFQFISNGSLVTVRVTGRYWSTAATTLHHWCRWRFLHTIKTHNDKQLLQCFVVTWGITKVPAELDRLCNILWGTLLSLELSGSN